jgi:hypothetical protein
VPYLYHTEKAKDGRRIHTAAMLYKRRMSERWIRWVRSGSGGMAKDGWVGVGGRFKLFWLRVDLVTSYGTG